MESKVEREVKILNIDTLEMEDRIIKNGGILIAKEYQKNILIDSEENPVKKLTNGYLRIREVRNLISQEKSTEFTLKKNMKNTDSRENLEYNMEIENKDVLLSILRELGFNSIKIGYKERTSYSLLNCRIDMDIWDEDTYPYPYMEIEFTEDSDLEKVIERLKINRDDISKKSILELRSDLNLF